MVNAYFGLPQEVVFCKSCVISNQRPRSAVEFKSRIGSYKETIDFGVDGVCEACKYAEYKRQNIDWDSREKMLVSLLDKYRRRDGRYDVVVPGSGGKDSAYTSHILKYKYGMNPLTATWAPHKYTDIGWKNFENWIHVGGLDNLLFTPNGRLHRYLTRLAFLNLCHPFQPFIIGQRLLGPMIATKFDIPLVMYGENQAEYGNNSEENSISTMNNAFFSIDSPENIVLGGKSIGDILSDGEFSLGDFASYIPPSLELLNNVGVVVHYLGYYLPWDPQECFYYATEHTGFQANTERTEGTYSKYASIDDRIDRFHYYTTLIKFGIGHATYDASQEIRNRKITREEAVALVRRYDQEFPKKYFKDFLEYISITAEQFFDLIDNYRSPHLWSNSNGEWKLKHTVWSAVDE